MFFNFLLISALWQSQPLSSAGTAGLPLSDDHEDFMEILRISFTAL